MQGPTTMFSSFLFGQSFSFCFVGYKATESLQPEATDSSAKERQWGAQYWLGPNTKYNPLPSPGSVLHTLKTGSLAESLTLQLASLHRRKGLTEVGFRMRQGKNREPSAQNRQVEAGIGSVSVPVCPCVCVYACLCPAAVLKIRRHHPLAGSSETPSWVISNSYCTSWLREETSQDNLGPFLCLVTALNILWTTISSGSI